MEKKKRRFSWFDIAVAAVVLFGVLAWFFVINRPPQVEQPMFEESRAVYHLEVINLTAEQAAQVQPGDALQESMRHTPIGRVLSVEIRPHVVRVEEDETQTIRWDEVEDRWSIVMAVETDVRETDRDILAEGQFPIKGGHIFSITGPGYGFAHATILGIERGA